MTLLAALTAALEAAAAALRAFPLWMQWRITGECESLSKQILAHEAAATPHDRAAADELRIAYAYRRQLHAALQSRHTGDPSGHTNPNPPRAVSRPGG